MRDAYRSREKAWSSAASFASDAWTSWRLRLSARPQRFRDDDPHKTVEARRRSISE